MIAFQEPDTLTCPKCGRANVAGGITSTYNGGQAPTTTAGYVPTAEWIQLVCGRCQYGANGQWLMAVKS